MIPSNLQSILWSKSVKKLDLEKDKIYVINQILAYGSLENVKWLFKNIPKSKIENIFINHPQKIYTKSAFHFTKTILLNLKINLDEKKYLKNLS